MKYEEYRENGFGSERSSDEIQRDLELIRSEMSDTLRQLEDRFSPRAMFDEALQRFRTAGSGTGDFVANLGSTVRDNPVGVLLLATGAASLLMSQHTEGGRESEIKSEAKGRWQQVKRRAGEIGQAAGERAGSTGERIGEAAEEARHAASDIGHRIQEASGQLRTRGDRLLHEHPMVLLGLGLALGSAIAGTAPVTQKERELASPHPPPS